MVLVLCVFAHSNTDCAVCLCMCVCVYVVYLPAGLKALETAFSAGPLVGFSVISGLVLQSVSLASQ